VPALITIQWVGTTGTPLFTTETQLVTTGTPLVSLASTGLPWAAHCWNTLGNTPGETYYNVDEILVTTGNTPGINCEMVNNWLPLEYPWKHCWENLLNAAQLATTGIPLVETSLGKRMKC
jgi:hypothetical protein